MKIRKMHMFFLALFAMMMAVTANAATVKLSKKKITVPVATKYTLKVTGTKAKVKWNSSNKKIATVSSKGVVKGIKKGSCKVIATVEGEKYTCNVKVAQQTLKLNTSSKTIGKGKKFILKATVKNAKSKKVVWKSSNKAVATVSAKGVVKGVKSGKAIITATLKENKKISKKFKVTVKTYVSKIVPGKNWKDGTYYINSPMSLNGSSEDVPCNKIIPTDADNKKVVYSSSNSKVATVSADGVIDPISRGTAVITGVAADKEGATISRIVKVVDMNDYLKEVIVTKDNFLSLFGWKTVHEVEIQTVKDIWEEEQILSERTSFYLTNKQFGNDWHWYARSGDFAVELAITYQYKDVNGEIKTETERHTVRNRILSLSSEYYQEPNIINIEVLRVKENSVAYYLSNRTFKSASEIKKDNLGRKYVVKTCIDGLEYCAYEDNAMVEFAFVRTITPFKRKRVIFVAD